MPAVLSRPLPHRSAGRLPPEKRLFLAVDRSYRSCRRVHCVFRRNSMLHKPFAMAALLAASCGAQAASDADLAAIRGQIDEMKKSYEQRIARKKAGPG
jgi:hypothetical protein